MNDETKRRDRLLKDMQDLDRLGGDVEDSLRLLLEASTRTREAESKFLKFVRTVERDSDLPEQTWAHVESNLSARLNATRITRGHMAEVQPLFLGTAQSSLTSTSTATGAVSVAEPWLSGVAAELEDLCIWPSPPDEATKPTIRIRKPEQLAAFKDLAVALQEAQSSKDLLPEVITLIVGLGADQPHPGTRSATDHFSAALRAFEHPPGGVTSPPAVLLELREGVNALLERLRRRLQKQVPGGTVSERVAIIGAQAGYLIFAADHFDRLGLDLESLTKHLTDGKANTMTRDQVRSLMTRVLFTVHAVLSAIDPKRLRTK